MADDDPVREIRLWPEQWAIDAAVKVETIRQQVKIAQADPAVQADPRRQAVEKAIEALLGKAQGAVQRRRGRLPMRNPSDKWRGTSIVRAYQSIHAAEVFLVDLLPDRQVATLIPKVVAKLDAVLEPDDPRRKLVEQLTVQARGRVPTQRAVIQQAMAFGYEAADQLHVRVRNFRNILLASAALITLLMAGLVFLVSQRPTALPLCFPPSPTRPSATAPASPASSPTPTADTGPTPTPTAGTGPTATPTAGTGPAATPTPAAEETPAPAPAGADGTEENACPSGENQPSTSEDVIIVTVLGLLGGALAAAFSIRGIRGTSVPYDVPIALALLKVPSGSLTALAGIVLLGGAFVPGLSELDSQPQILAYALVLGYAQQLATRLIDNRAQTILDSVPSKESNPSSAKPPVPSAPSPSPRTIWVVRRAARRRERPPPPPPPPPPSDASETPTEPAAKESPTEPAEKEPPAEPPNKELPTEPADKELPTEPADKERPAEPPNKE